MGNKIVGVVDLTPMMNRKRQLEEEMRTAFPHFLQLFATAHEITIEEATDLVLDYLHQGRASEEHG